MNTKTLIIASTIIAGGYASLALCEPSSLAESKGLNTRGLNLSKYHSIVDEVRGSPSHGRVVFQATGESEEMIYHSSARIGPFEAAGETFGKARDYVLHLGLPTDLQADVDHPVDRIEPVELALAGLTDCVIGTIRVHALVNGIELDHVTATVRAPLGLEVLLGIHDVEQRDDMYEEISIQVAIEGPDLTEKQRRFLSEELKRSPVFNLVALSHEMDTVVRIRN